MLDSVRLAYLLCRAADALEDSWPGTPRQITERFDALVSALLGDASATTWLAGSAAAQHARADIELVVRLPLL